MKSQIKNDKALVVAILAGLLVGLGEADARVFVIVILSIVGRFLIETFSMRPLPPWVVNTLTLFYSGFIYLKYHTFLSIEASMALFIGLMSLKTLDYKSLRDKKFIVLMVILVLGVKPLNSIDIYWLVPILGGYVCCFYSIYNGSSSNKSVGTLAKWILLVMPGTLILFFVFPRVIIPLSYWYNGVEREGLVGFSGQLSPGTVASLKSRDELVFRAKFKQKKETAHLKIFGRDLYWRGAALHQSRGFSWTPGKKSSLAATELKVTGAKQVEYTIVQEPISDRTLFSLDRVAELNPVNAMDQVVKTSDVYASVHPITKSFAYEVISKMEYQDSTQPLKEDLEVGIKNSQRLLDFVAEIKAQSPDEKTRLNKLKDFFTKSGFEYTLSPGVYDRQGIDDFLFDRKKGFCEHFSGAYAMLARMLGVPSRVIVGFQGGDYNSFGEYWRISTLNAHAWVEIYVEGHWQRVDPTSWIQGFSEQAAAMGLIEGGGSGLRNEKKYGSLGVFLYNLESRLDAINYKWTNFLIEFDLGSQQSFWWMMRDSFSLVIFLWVLALVVLVTLIFVFLRGLKGAPLLGNSPYQPVIGALSKWMEKLGGRGIYSFETPHQYIEKELIPRFPVLLNLFKNLANDIDRSDYQGLEGIHKPKFYLKFAKREMFYKK